MSARGVEVPGEEVIGDVGEAAAERRSVHIPGIRMIFSIISARQVLILILTLILADNPYPCRSGRPRGMRSERNAHKLTRYVRAAHSDGIAPVMPVSRMDLTQSELRVMKLIYFRGRNRVTSFKSQYSNNQTN